MNRPDADLDRQVDALVDACRSTCLWFLRPDYYPRTDAERRRVLETIQKHASLDIYRQAAKLKQCL